MLCCPSVRNLLWLGTWACSPLFFLPPQLLSVPQALSLPVFLEVGAGKTVRNRLGRGLGRAILHSRTHKCQVERDREVFLPSYLPSPLLWVLQSVCLLSTKTLRFEVSTLSREDAQGILSHSGVHRWCITVQGWFGVTKNMRDTGVLKKRR